jgi:hypothetical protein
MSRSMEVPPGVPSVLHGSTPVPGWNALNQTRAPAKVHHEGVECAGPGATSASSIVPAAVPSETHGSMPCVPSLARNTHREPVELSQSG